MASPAANREAHQQLVAELREKLAVAALGGGAARPRQTRRAAASCCPAIGSTPARPRHAVPGAVARWRPTGMYGDEAARRRHHHRHRPGRRAVECVIVANDATVKGGTYYPMTVKKHLRAQEIARAEPPALHLPGRLRRRLPAAAGRGVPRPRPLRPHLLQPGHDVSAAGIPQIAVVLGSCTAGGAYVPAMSDETVIVREQGTIFLGGPPLVKAATGEVVTAEDLGGADVHTRISGVADHLADDDAHALRIVRDIVATLDPRSAGAVARARAASRRRTTRTSCYGVVPVDPRKPYDVREVIARIVDGARVPRVQGALRHHAGLRLRAHLTAIPVGIVANNGILFSRVRAEGRALHRAVRPARHPAGVPAEHHRLHGGQRVRGRRHRQGRRQDGHRRRLRPGAQVHRDHRRLATAPATTRMCGRAYSPRFLWMWPNARISVMGGEQAAAVLATVKRDQHRGQGGSWPRRGGGASRRRSATSTSSRATRTTPPRGCGTTASSTRPTPARCWAWRSRLRATRRCEPVSYGVFRM